MEIVKCPKCKSNMYCYFDNYFCENCGAYSELDAIIKPGYVVNFPTLIEYKPNESEAEMEKPKEDAICPNCGASDWKPSYSTKEKRDYQVCQKCAFHFPADQTRPKTKVPKGKKPCPNCGDFDWKPHFTETELAYECRNCGFISPLDLWSQPAKNTKTADYIGRGLAVLFLLAVGAGLSVIPFEQTARCLIIVLAIILGIMIGGIATIPHSKKDK